MTAAAVNMATVYNVDGMLLCAASLWPPLSSELAKTGTKGSSAILATELEVVGKGPVPVEATVGGNILSAVAF